MLEPTKRITRRPSVSTTGGGPGSTCPVRVAVRVRPPEYRLPRDQTRPLCVIPVESHAAPTTSPPPSPRPTTTTTAAAAAAATSGQAAEFQGKRYTFDHVFGPSTTQQELYVASLQPLLSQFLDGFNVTVIAYGQTGSGKTFTMGSRATVLQTTPTTSPSRDRPPSPGSLLPPPQIHSYRGSADDGLIPRFLSDLFTNLKKEPSVRTIQVSFVEVYCDTIRDLLDERAQEKTLNIREDQHSVWIDNLRQIRVESLSKALELMNAGRARQVTAANAINDQSSRSHAVYTMEVTRKFMNEVKKSKLTFVDLAGSERVKKTQVEGLRLKESIQINAGLSALGNVINMLADDRRGNRRSSTDSSSIAPTSPRTTSPDAHVPYRSSKLTRLLKDALGGNSRTLFIACVSPLDSDAEETGTTLKYANRVRNIRNKAEKNSEHEMPILHRSSSQLEISRLQDEVMSLRQQISELESIAKIRAQELADAEAGRREKKAARIRNRRDVEVLTDYEITPLVIVTDAGVQSDVINACDAFCTDTQHAIALPGFDLANKTTDAIEIENPGKSEESRSTERVDATCNTDWSLPASDPTIGRCIDGVFPKACDIHVIRSLMAGCNDQTHSQTTLLLSHTTKLSGNQLQELVVVKQNEVLDPSCHSDVARIQAAHHSLVGVLDEMTQEEQKGFPLGETQVEPAVPAAQIAPVTSELLDSHVGSMHAKPPLCLINHDPSEYQQPCTSPDPDGKVLTEANLVHPDCQTDGFSSSSTTPFDLLLPTESNPEKLSPLTPHKASWIDQSTLHVEENQSDPAKPFCGIDVTSRTLSYDDFLGTRHPGPQVDFVSESCKSPSSLVPIDAHPTWASVDTMLPPCLRIAVKPLCTDDYLKPLGPMFPISPHFSSNNSDCSCGDGQSTDGYRTPRGAVECILVRSPTKYQDERSCDLFSPCEMLEAINSQPKHCLDRLDTSSTECGSSCDDDHSTDGYRTPRGATEFIIVRSPTKAREQEVSDLPTQPISNDEGSVTLKPSTTSKKCASPINLKPMRLFAFDDQLVRHRSYELDELASSVSKCVRDLRQDEELSDITGKHHTDGMEALMTRSGASHIVVDTLLEAKKILLIRQMRQRRIEQLRRRLRMLETSLGTTTGICELDHEHHVYIARVQEKFLQEWVHRLEGEVAQRLRRRLRARKAAMDLCLLPEGNQTDDGELHCPFLQAEQYRACQSWFDACENDCTVFQQQVLPLITSGWISVDDSVLREEEMWFEL